MGKIILIGLIITIILLLSGCINGEKWTGNIYKEGSIVNIEENVIFGFTFTDWKDVIYFDDGTRLNLKESDLYLIRENVTGVYHFKENKFEYDGSDYHFHKLIDVRYYDELEI